MTTQCEDAGILRRHTTPRTTVESRPEPLPRLIGTNRLDLRTDEATVVIAEDTPPPLTAVRLASVRRVAGARLFPDSTNLPGHDNGWEMWAEGLVDDDDQLAALCVELAPRTPRLARWVRRLTPRGGGTAHGERSRRRAAPKPEDPTTP